MATELKVEPTTSSATDSGFWLLNSGF